MTDRIRIDLHNHTHFSPDNILSPKQFVQECRRRGLDRVAVTDHNTIRGALATRELADFPIIIGEEILTADGEIIGLFLEEEVPRGLPAEETVERIKAQGGVAGVPHPFDHLRRALREDELRRVIDKVDYIEALNARIVFPANNRQARAFAKEHGLPVSPGSDAHSAGEVGRVFADMPSFDGPADFLEALGDAKLGGKLSNPLIHLVSRYAKLRRWLGWRPT